MYDKHWWLEVLNEAQIRIFFIKYRVHSFLQNVIFVFDKDDIILQLCYAHSKSELLTCCASSTNSPQFLTPYNCLSLCLANPRYHNTDATWEQTPTTRALARHLQYHALSSRIVYWPCKPPFFQLLSSVLSIEHSWNS